MADKERTLKMLYAEGDDAIRYGTGDLEGRTVTWWQGAPDRQAGLVCVVTGEDEGYQRALLEPPKESVA